MTKLFWFISPWYNRGNPSMYELPFDLGGSLNRLLIYTLRKYPKLHFFFPGLKLGQWPNRVALPKIENIDLNQNNCSVLYLGHRTCYIKLGDCLFLTDPVFARRILSGGFGVKRVDYTLYKYWQLPKADVLLYSNNSFDCLDSWTLRKISDHGRALVVGGKNLSKYLLKFFKHYTYTLKWFEEVDFGSVRVTFVPSASQTRRNFLACGIDLNLMLWGGFLLTDGTKIIYYAGRTAYSDHFKEIRQYLNDRTLDLSILPIGPCFHQKKDMNPEEAVQAHIDLHSKKTLLVAYDTFPMGVEAYGELKDRLLQHVDKLDQSRSFNLKKQFVFLSNGETLHI